MFVCKQIACVYMVCVWLLGDEGEAEPRQQHQSQRLHQRQLRWREFVQDTLSFRTPPLLGQASVYDSLVARWDHFILSSIAVEGLLLLLWIYGKLIWISELKACCLRNYLLRICRTLIVYNFWIRMWGSHVSMCRYRTKTRLIITSLPRDLWSTPAPTSGRWSGRRRYKSSSCSPTNG